MSRLLLFRLKRRRRMEKKEEKGNFVREEGRKEGRQGK
jgi:hypothetical protein